MANVPNSIVVNTGDDYLFGSTIEDFFKEVMGEYFAKFGDGPHFEVKTFGTNIPTPSVIHQPTDDNLTLLYFQGRVVAGVIETRTDSNYVQHSYFQNRLEDVVGE